jgi:pyruvate formate lyase activating enzyme
MKICLGDIIPTSTLDWSGKVSLVVFTRGCPLRCPYCSNSRFIEIPEDYVPEDTKKVKDEIFRASKFIDAVVISGGEPLMQHDAVEEIASYTKELGLLVGIHTNGVYPDRIGELSEKGLLDAVFLDIKAPMERTSYALAAGPVDDGTLRAINNSLTLCSALKKLGKLAYFEVRTTVFKGISDTPGDIVKIVSSIPRADVYAIQQGRPEVAMDEELKKTDAIMRNDIYELARAAKSSANGVKVLKIRTHTFGDEIVS